MRRCRVSFDDLAFARAGWAQARANAGCGGRLPDNRAFAERGVGGRSSGISIWPEHMSRRGGPGSPRASICKFLRPGLWCAVDETQTPVIDFPVAPYKPRLHHDDVSRHRRANRAELGPASGLGRARKRTPAASSRGTLSCGNQVSIAESAGPLRAVIFLEHVDNIFQGPGLEGRRPARIERCSVGEHYFAAACVDLRVRYYE